MVRKTLKGIIGGLLFTMVAITAVIALFAESYNQTDAYILGFLLLIDSILFVLFDRL